MGAREHRGVPVLVGEGDTDTFGQFQIKVMQAICEYPVASALKLIPGMAVRCATVIEARGAMTKY